MSVDLGLGRNPEINAHLQHQLVEFMSQRLRCVLVGDQAGEAVEVTTIRLVDEAQEHLPSISSDADIQTIGSSPSNLYGFGTGGS